MIGSMIGTVANIVLDPVLISGMGMGAAGARSCDDNRKYFGKHLLPVVFFKEK